MKLLQLGLVPQKPQFLLVVCLLFITPFFAQVGIGTVTPDPSSELDIQSTDGGLLIPRMIASERTAIASPATGLMVYQTDAPDGFYYYDGTSWQEISAGNAGWKTTGNAGTNAATDFIGTTDDEDVVFKRNNVRYGVFQEAVVSTIPIENMGFGKNVFENITFGTGNVAFGAESLSLTTTGSRNVAIGELSLSSNQAGSANTAIGFEALKNSNTINNIAIGDRAMTENVGGQDNVGIGNFSLWRNTYGDSNIGIGSNALRNNTNGNGNIAIGNASANHNSTGSSNIAIGSSSLFRNATGYANVAIGVSSLANNITANQNVAIGASSLRNNTTGPGNSAMGYQSLYGNTIGEFNTASGYDALYSNTTGSSNSAFGVSSLRSNTTGSSNNAMGRNSLLSNTTGYNNTAVGNNSLNDNSTGYQNTTVGSNSLSNNTTGIGNVAMGASALFNNTTANYNSAFGFRSLQANSVGTRNASFGANAMLANTTANDNAAFGFSALSSNTTGEDNTALGSNALQFNVDGYHNTSIGSQSLRSNTSGYENTALGYNSLRLNTIGAQNIAIGPLSLENNISGLSNTAIGYNSLMENETGDSNTAVGNGALQNNRVGANTAVGASAMFTNIAGQFNVAVGNGAMLLNTYGNDNTAIGYNSLRSNRLGQFNTAIGEYALRNNVDGSSNVAIGMSAFATGDGDQNTGLGSYTNLSTTGLTNATAIGAQAEVGVSNSMVLGSINGVNGATSNVNVGIGTTTPSATLDVVGDFKLTDGNEALGYVLSTDALGNSTWVDPNTLINNDNDWTVVGPDIQRQSGNIYVGFSPGTNSNIYLSNRILDWDDTTKYIDPNGTSSVNQVVYENGTTANPSIRFSDVNTGIFSPTAAEIGISVNGSERIRIDNTGQLGVRQTNPLFNVHLKQLDNLEGGTGGMAFESVSSTVNWKVYHSGAHFSFAENGTRRAYIEAASGNYIQPSDARLKQEFELQSNYLSKLKQLPIYTYRYKNQQGNKRSLGIKAQEVQSLFPELISEGEDGYLGMNYAGLSVVAVQAIKEQQEKIDLLTEENKKLNAKNTTLENRLDQLLLRLEVIEATLDE